MTNERHAGKRASLFNAAAVVPPPANTSPPGKQGLIFEVDDGPATTVRRAAGDMVLGEDAGAHGDPLRPLLNSAEELTHL